MHFQVWEQEEKGRNTCSLASPHKATGAGAQHALESSAEIQSKALQACGFHL
jgi:hypothetical protein